MSHDIIIEDRIKECNYFDFISQILTEEQIENVIN